MSSPLPRWHRIAVLLLLGAFAVLCIHALIWDSPTVDEFTHLPAGLHYLATGRFEMGSRNPPLVKVLAALPPYLLLHPEVNTEAQVTSSAWYPWIYSTDFMERNRPIFDRVFLLGRLVIVAIGLLLGTLIYRWSRELYGAEAGLVALTLFAFCPTLIGHAHLVTIDVGASTAILLALYLFYRFVHEPTVPRLLLSGLGLGIAEITKLTALFLYPLFVLLAVVVLARGGRFSVRRREGEGILGSAAALLGIFLLSLLVIDLGYLFQGVGRPLESFVFQSHFMKTVSGIVPAWLPMPLPSAYLEGFDAVRLDTELGEFPNYLFGRWSKEGSPIYYLVTFLFKTPLPLIAACLAAPFVRLRPSGEPERPRGEIFVALPLAVLFAAFALFSLKVNYGIRHILPTFPLLLIFASRLTPVLAARGRAVRTAALAVLLLYPVSAVLATPNTLSYFNILAGGRPDRILLDSNLDWGQGLKRVRAYMDREGLDQVDLAYFGHVDPAIYGIRWQFPDPGRTGPVIVSANFLHGYSYATYANGKMLMVPPGAFTWIGRFPRVEDLGGGLYVHRIGEAPPVR